MRLVKQSLYHRIVMLVVGIWISYIVPQELHCKRFNGLHMLKKKISMKIISIITIRC
jgi:hypothetical protein